MFTLNVSKRNIKAPLKELRKSGFVPAVFYGAKEQSCCIAVKETDFIKVWKEAGESSVVVLKDSDGEYESLIHDVQKDPVSGKLVHVDFYILEKGKKVSVKVPLEFIGVSDAVKALGGTLVKVMHEIEVEATPANLPHDIKVDVSKLVTFDDQIHVSDLVLPNGVELEHSVNPNDVVALATPPKEETEETPSVLDLDSIEVEKKGKKEEEGTDTPAA